jgi:hypothetical protein
MFGFGPGFFPVDFHPSVLMKKDELTLQLARAARLTPAEAADQLDDVVHGIVKKLRRGKPATLPGFGKLLPSGPNSVRFSGSPSRPNRRGR